MSAAFEFTETLVLCKDIAEVEVVFKKYVPLISGWDISKVTVEGKVLKVEGIEHRDGMYGTTERVITLLMVDLSDGREIYGRLNTCGLAAVDLTIIGNLL